MSKKEKDKNKAGQEPKIAKKAGSFGKNIKKVWADNLNKALIISVFVLNFAAWVAISLKVLVLPAPIILQYNAYLGVAFKGSPYWSFVLTGSGLMVALLNLGLVLYFPGTGKRGVTKMLLGSALLFNLFVDLGLAALIFVNEI